MEGVKKIKKEGRGYCLWQPLTPPERGVGCLKMRHGIDGGGVIELMTRKIILGNGIPFPSEFYSLVDPVKAQFE